MLRCILKNLLCLCSLQIKSKNNKKSYLISINETSLNYKNNFKKMKKIITALVLSVAFTSIINAQEGFHKVGVGAEVALPMGNFGDGFSTGFGATGKVFYGISEEADITATVGYLHFGMKGNNYVSGHVGMVPIQFGYRHSFDGFYAEPQLGVMLLSSKVEIKGSNGLFGNTAGTASETKFSIGIGGGYEHGDWDFSLRYQIVDQANFLGLRVGYNFSI